MAGQWHSPARNRGASFYCKINGKSSAFGFVWPLWVALPLGRTTVICVRLHEFCCLRNKQLLWTKEWNWDEKRGEKGERRREKREKVSRETSPCSHSADKHADPLVPTVLCIRCGCFVVHGRKPVADTRAAPTTRRWPKLNTKLGGKFNNCTTKIRRHAQCVGLQLSAAKLRPVSPMAKLSADCAIATGRFRL